MKIGELISLLEGYPLDMRVVVQGYENGFDDVLSEQVKVVRIQLDRGTERWDGRHQEPFLKKEISTDSDVVDALALLRTSN